MNIRHRLLLRTAGLATLGATLVLPVGARAALLEVRQTVFGMDCAPCAYGLQRALRALPGARTAQVQLNDGIARVAFRPGSPATLEQIRTLVRNQGFSPRAAWVRAEGRLRRQGTDWSIELAPGARYRVVPPRGATRPIGLPDGTPLRVEGTIAEAPRKARRGDLPQLRITSYVPARDRPPTEVPPLE